MSVIKDTPKILFFCIPIFLFLACVLFLGLLFASHDTVLAIYGSIAVSALITIMFFIYAYKVDKSDYFYTKDKVTKKYILKLILGLFCSSYVISSYAVYVLYSKEVGMWMFYSIGLILLIIRILEKKD